MPNNPTDDDERWPVTNWEREPDSIKNDPLWMAAMKDLEAGRDMPTALMNVLQPLPEHIEAFLDQITSTMEE